MRSDTRIKADTLDYSLRIKALHLGISVEFVEIAHTESEISVSEKLDSLSLLHAHEKSRDVLFERALPEKRRESLCSLIEAVKIGDRHYCCILLGKTLVVYHFRNTGYDARRVEIVIQSLALTKKLGEEQEVEPLHAP